MALNKNDLRRAGLGCGVAFLTLLVFLIASPAFAAKPPAECGDGKCNRGETQSSCPLDCGGAVDVCGDLVCGASETNESCPDDCAAPPPVECNNDGVCNAGEDCLGCADCPGKTGGKPANRFCCGSDTCEAARCGAGCGAAPPECGNEVIDYNEECDDGPTGSPTCDIFCKVIVGNSLVPLNQFNIGDSIGEGEAANGSIGEANHQAVWSTGYDGGDVVYSLNERFEALDAAAYLENNATRDASINQAVSGAVMADFASQAQNVVNSMTGIDPAGADMVSILLGNNDVCADSLAAMTAPDQFEAQYRAGLEILASNPMPETANLLISGIPAIYWLWEAKRDDFWCRAFAWPFVPCENLLQNAANDCISSESAQNPDVFYDGDGSNCVRRKQFHALIRDEYNTILSDVLAEYQAQEKLLNAEYVDIYDVRFQSEHVNGGDCFHPSKAGHALMAREQWCRSKWSEGDPACSQ